MKNIARYLLAGVLVTTFSQVACKKKEDEGWYAAYLIINSSSCQLDSKNEFNGTLRVEVEAEEKRFPFRERGSRKFKFDRSNDLDPGLGVKFAIQLPDRKYAYWMSTNWSTPSCDSCSICDDKCGNSGSHIFSSRDRQIYTESHADENEVSVFLTDKGPEEICICEYLACRTGDNSGGASSTGGSSAGGASGGGSAGGVGGSSDGGSPGDAGSGGESASGGSGSGGDTGAGGAIDSGGESGAGGSVSVDPLCGQGMDVVGQYATWCGKVNVHQTDDGTWVSDSDCTSGCNINTVSYCQKFWPTSTTQVALEKPSSDNKVFEDWGCSSGFASPGQAQYACCAPR
jgi:hypothetical protein